ncbi:hypothetical protein BJX66DRAFT_83270 [Aspergillus keveii]|uniref:Secreted protein n=1 Tax=Aspergillus keveii TaxID=714993 RepID=A0ABR4GFI2_9EURO
MQWSALGFLMPIGLKVLGIAFTAPEIMVLAWDMAPIMGSRIAHLQNSCRRVRVPTHAGCKPSASFASQSTSAASCRVQSHLCFRLGFCKGAFNQPLRVWPLQIVDRKN